MNKIVREHYPAARLPEDLREGFEKDATVRVIIEPESADLPTAEIDLLPGFRHLQQPDRDPMTVEELAESIKRYKALGKPSVTMDEAVARIRELRDEWDD